MGGGASKATKAPAKPPVITITDETEGSNGRCHTAPLTKPQTLAAQVLAGLCQAWGLEAATTLLCAADGTTLAGSDGKGAALTMQQVVDTHGPAMVLRSVVTAAATGASADWLANGDACSFTLDESCPAHAPTSRLYGVYPGTVDFCIEPKAGDGEPRYKVGSDTAVIATIAAKLRARGIGVGDGYWPISVASGQADIFLPAAKVQRGHDAALAFWDARAQTSAPKSFAVGDACSVQATSTSGGGNRMYAGEVVAADNAAQVYDVKWLNKPPGTWVERGVHSSRLVRGSEAGYAPDIEAARIASAEKEAEAKRREEQKAWEAAEWAKVEARKPALLAEFQAAHPGEEPVFWCPNIGARSQARYVTAAAADALREELRLERERDRAELAAAVDAAAQASAAASAAGGGSGAAAAAAARGPGHCKTGGAAREARQALTKHQAPKGLCHKGKRFTTGKCPVCGAATGTI